MSKGLAAEILVSGAPTFASYAAADLFERDPAASARGAGDFQQWQAFYRRLLEDLAAAIRVESADVFAARVRWQRVAFESRGTDVALLHTAVSSLFSVVEENLPPVAQKSTDPFFRAALDVLAQNPPALRSALSPDSDHGRLALRYLDAIFSGDRRSAISMIEDAAKAGAQIPALYLKVLIPALVEVGRLWHLGEITVAEEHFVSETTRSVMSILARMAPIAPPTGRTVVTASVQGNAHDFGPRVVADFFEMAGWRAVCLGADVPTSDLERAVTFFRADLLALSVTIASHLDAARRAIQTLRREDPDVRILVGGHAFLDSPDIWRNLGADGYVAGVESAPQAGLELVGGPNTER